MTNHQKEARRWKEEAMHWKSLHDDAIGHNKRLSEENQKVLHRLHETIKELEKWEGIEPSESFRLHRQITNLHEEIKACHDVMKKAENEKKEYRTMKEQHDKLLDYVRSL